MAYPYPCHSRLDWSPTFQDLYNDKQTLDAFSILSIHFLWHLPKWSIITITHLLEWATISRITDPTAQARAFLNNLNRSAYSIMIFRSQVVIYSIVGGMGWTFGSLIVLLSRCVLAFLGLWQLYHLEDHTSLSKGTLSLYVFGVLGNDCGTQSFDFVI